MATREREIWIAQAAGFAFFLMLPLAVFFASRGSDSRVWQILGVVLVIPSVAFVAFVFVSTGDVFIRLAFALQAGAFPLIALIAWIRV